MKKNYTYLILPFALSPFISSAAPLTANDDFLIEKAKDVIKQEMLDPSVIEKAKLSDFKFFPDQDDTEYSRSGYVCGNVAVELGDKKADLVSVIQVTERLKKVLIKDKHLYDMSKDSESDKSDISSHCK